MRPSLSVLIVAWNSREELARTLPALLPELGEGDELIVVDNDSGDGTAEAVARAGAARRGSSGLARNLGFAAGCNAGAAAASGDLLVILNPDAAPLPGFGEAIRRPWLRGPRLGRLAGAGRRRRGGPGSTPPATRSTSPASSGPAATASRSPRRRRPARSRSSPAPAWRSRCGPGDEVGGFPERFFLYHEDVDLSLRLRLRGGALGIEPAAVVDHDYEFGAREHKWRWLERNRLAFLVRAYPAALLLLLAPALLATELALLAVSAAGGWGRQKLAREPRIPALAAAPAARAPPDPGAPAPSAPPSSPPG